MGKKLLRREEDAILDAIFLVIGKAIGLTYFGFLDVSRDCSFRIEVRQNSIDLPPEAIQEELAAAFGAVVSTSEGTIADGCCEFCYTEDPSYIFDVSNVTKHWPTEELLKLRSKKKR